MVQKNEEEKRVHREEAGVMFEGRVRKWDEIGVRYTTARFPGFIFLSIFKTQSVSGVKSR